MVKKKFFICIFFLSNSSCLLSMESQNAKPPHGIQMQAGSSRAPETLSNTNLHKVQNNEEEYIFAAIVCCAGCTFAICGTIIHGLQKLFHH